MTYLVCLLLPVALAGSDSISEGRELFHKGQYLGAEAYFLGSNPRDEDVPELVYYLSRISLEQGSPEAKTRYFQKKLSEDPMWRRIALGVLANVAASRGDWESFGEYGASYLQSLNQPAGEAHYPLLYYLARYTRVQGGDLGLMPKALRWFSVCADLKDDRRFPKDLDPHQPYFYRHLHLLEGDISSLPKPPDEDESEAARYLYKLLGIRHAVQQQQWNEAATRINAFLPYDRDLNRKSLSILFQEQVIHYFDQKGIQARAKKWLAKRARYLSEAVLPLVLLPDVLVHRDHVEPAPIKVETSTEIHTDLEEQQVGPAVEPQPQPSPIATRDTHQLYSEWAQLELGIRTNHNGDLEKQIAAIKPKGRYEAIYKTFLMGFYYLHQGHYINAESLLNEAYDAVKPWPFPDLQIKILSAFGQYYRLQNNLERAEWYLLTATRIWDDNDHLPLLALWHEYPFVDPFDYLIDHHLEQVSSEKVLPKLLYYREMRHYLRMRQLAFRRKTLADNQVLANQLFALGEQISAHLLKLANGQSATPNPRAYEEALVIWDQLWKQVLPEYEDFGNPTQAEIQAKIGKNGLALCFVEGENRLGVLVFTKSRAFAVGLGLKKQFLAMGDQQRIRFLERRLGPVWTTSETLYLCLSETLKKANVLSDLRPVSRKGEPLRVAFSMRTFVAPLPLRDNCKGTLVFSDAASGPVTKLVKLFPAEQLDWFAENAKLRSQMLKYLPHKDHLVLSLQPIPHQKGLLVLEKERSFYLHEIYQHQKTLCSLYWMAPQNTQWESFLDELEIFKTATQASIVLGHDPSSMRLRDKSGFGGVFVY